MNITQILESKGWKRDKIAGGRRLVTILRHPTQNIYYSIQSHEFRTGLRTIARISSRNVHHCQDTDLIIVDGFIAIKA